MKANLFLIKYYLDTEISLSQFIGVFKKLGVVFCFKLFGHEGPFKRIFFAKYLFFKDLNFSFEINIFLFRLTYLNKVYHFF
jgi:hypothetical protein